MNNSIFWAWRRTKVAKALIGARDLYITIDTASSSFLFVVDILQNMGGGESMIAHSVQL
jgi:hypothetical protein